MFSLFLYTYLRFFLVFCYNIFLFLFIIIFILTVVHIQLLLLLFVFSFVLNLFVLFSRPSVFFVVLLFFIVAPSSPNSRSLPVSCFLFTVDEQKTHRWTVWVALVSIMSLFERCRFIVVSRDTTTLLGERQTEREGERCESVCYSGIRTRLLPKYVRHTRNLTWRLVNNGRQDREDDCRRNKMKYDAVCSFKTRGIKVKTC